MMGWKAAVLGGGAALGPALKGALKAGGAVKAEVLEKVPACPAAAMLDREVAKEVTVVRRP